MDFLDTMRQYNFHMYFFPEKGILKFIENIYEKVYIIICFTDIFTIKLIV